MAQQLVEDTSRCVEGKEEKEEQDQVSKMQAQIAQLQMQLHAMQLKQPLTRRYHPGKLGKCHPMDLKLYKKQHLERYGKYHKKEPSIGRQHTMSYNGRVFPCCGRPDSSTSKPCTIVDITYTCCGYSQRSIGGYCNYSNQEGCAEGYLCCGGDKSSKGCYQKTKYLCCERPYGSLGCQMQYKCCGQHYASVGCQIKTD
eukprot:717554_1